MKKIDHVKKMVYIIVGILTIISLVFTIYKNISHAASSSTSPETFTSFPLPVGEGYGTELDSYSEYLIPDLLSWLNNNYQINDSNLYYITVYEGSNGSLNSVRVWYYANGFTVPHLVSSNFNAFDDTTSLYFQGLSNPVALSRGADDHYSFSLFSHSDGSQSVNLNFTQQPNNTYRPNIYNNFCTGYPIYVNSSYFPVLDQNDNIIFDDTGGSVFPSGHTKGGVLANYIDSEDLLEDSSDLPKVDTTPPADPSSNSGWFQKILNGIGRLNQSVQGGVLTIGDYIGAGIEKLEEKLGEVKDSITGLYGWFTEDFDKNQFENGLNSIPLISDLNGLKTLVENSGMFNWSDVTPAQSVSFTFDFGGAVLPHSTNTIDFSWYTGNVKTLCNAILCTFLVLGLFVTVINQIPSIIGGHSGDKGGGSDS